MRIIGLDLGTLTGYAYTSDGVIRATHCGVADFKPRRHEGGGMRFLRFRRFLRELIADPEETIVFFEEVAAHKGTHAAHVYGGLLGVLSEFCEGHSIPYRGLPVGSIKKHATGVGNAGKPMMLARACTEFGHIESEDAADALWVLSLGMKELELGDDFNR